MFPAKNGTTQVPPRKTTSLIFNWNIFDPMKTFQTNLFYIDRLFKTSIYLI